MKDLKAALSKSLEAEDNAVRSRFEKAESLLGSKRKKTKLSKVEGEQGKQAKKVKLSKPKVIRDSFSLPKDDYELIGKLQQRCLGMAQSASKSQLVRAGLHALVKMPDAELVKVLDSLEQVKTGRPASQKFSTVGKQTNHTIS
ncbi:hypothetical protein N836_07285 [Leptolyngbya sp. Heron Island J]|uniref:hypothetical protein n=1 Tax=Leptolyngbya sp. Heron Island J TaxID=1385935 RepID=UPI0003B9C9B5|nr:hypothetical protein [Leptolyngbya sp. Heron Island J]ESA36570.1 hypothetical protein N836_07285 [Leptolyngbya sp. Heron Island J]